MILRSLYVSEMSAMLCPQCGQEITGEERSCRECGYAVPAGLPPELAIPPIPPRPPYIPPLAAPPPASVAQTLPPVGTIPPPLPAFGMPASAPSGGAFPQVYLCRVCGTALMPFQSGCQTCGAPRGAVANPQDPTSTTFVFINLMLQQQPGVSAPPLFSGQAAAAARTGERRRANRLTAIIVVAILSVIVLIAFALIRGIGHVT